MTLPSKKIDTLVLTLLLLLGGGLISYLILNIDRCQWDFAAYYYAAVAWVHGGNSYDLATLSTLAQKQLPYNYVYPPMTRLLFVPFALVSFHTAVILFITVKIAALIMLLIVWRKNFIKSKNQFLWFAILIFGFNATLFQDFKVGNISIIEQLLLWFGFTFLIRKSPVQFCLCIIGASMFKMFPILFLLILPFTDFKKKYQMLFISVAIFAFAIAAQAIGSPTSFAGFMANAQALMYERGSYNPSTFVLLRDIAGHLSTAFHITISLQNVYGIFAVNCLAIAGISVLAIRKAKSFATDSNDKTYLITLVCIACFTYALIHPRLKDYSYILLLVPAFIVITRSVSLRVAVPLVALTMITSKSPLPGVNWVLPYFPLLVSAGLWVLLVWESFNPSMQKVNGGKSER